MANTSLRLLARFLWVGLLLSAAACQMVPPGIRPVSGFELERYLGKWHEIARLDHPFERGLTRVTAEYRRRADGDVKVINRGFNAAQNEWSEVIGKAYFVQGEDVGQLKVSFFGPFYGGYNIIELDKADYRYALVAGPDYSYLWVLARSPDLERATLERLVNKAKALGFPTEELIYGSSE